MKNLHATHQYRVKKNYNENFDRKYVLNKASKLVRMRCWWECCSRIFMTLQWRHNGHDSVSNHQPHDCLLNRLFRRRSKKTSKLRVTGLCAGNSPGTGEFPAQMASSAENVSIWRRHRGVIPCLDNGLSPDFFITLTNADSFDGAMSKKGL